MQVNYFYNMLSMTVSMNRRRVTRVVFPTRQRGLWVGLVVALVLSVIPAQFAFAQEAPATDSATKLNVKTYLPAVRVSPELCKKQNPSSPFGVQMYGQTSKFNPWHDALVESGAKWVRVPVEWRDAEPQNVTPDKYNWGKTPEGNAGIDAALLAARDGCYNVIATLGGNPEWAASYERGPLDKTSLNELQEFMGALVERFDGDGKDDAPGSPVINYFEIYNEPDAAAIPVTFRYGWGEDGDKYAEMLKAIYPVIKEANPNAQVVFGGIAYELFIEKDENGRFVESFTDDVLKAGGGDYFDIMNFHAFAAFENIHGAPGIWNKTQLIQNILADNNVTKPIIITESGQRSNDTSTQERQARYVTAIYAEAIAADVDIVIHWMLWDAGNFYDEFGLVTNDVPGIKKKAFFAYQFAVEMLEDVDYVRKLTDPELPDSDMVVYKYRNPDDNSTLYVAWLNPLKDETANANPPRLRLLASQVTTYDIYGNNKKTIRDQDDGNADGLVKIPVGSQPVYIIISP